MWRLRLSALAEQDIEEIPAHSEANFGEKARLRYEALLECALDEIATDPERPSVRHRDELGPGVRTYHLFHARNRARTNHGVVKHPRHLPIFQISIPNILDIGRVLHDAMDLADHLPAEYGPGASESQDQNGDEN
jgi:toxin ParE1/3/4